MPKSRIRMPFSRHRPGRLLAGLALAAASAGLVTAAAVGPAAAAAVPHGGTYVSLGAIGLDTIHDVATGRCLDSNAAGNAYTLPCNGGQYQDWYLYQYEESLPTTTVYFYAYQDAATGRCLDSNAAGNLYTTQGGSVYATYPCQAPVNTYQDWVPTGLGTSFFDWATGRCLDSNAAGNAYTLPCNGGPYQEWGVV
jgi:serine/threonine-protein kinase